MSDQPEPDRPEAPTLAELEARLADLPADEAARIGARIRPVGRHAPVAPDAATPPDPVYVSWDDYLARTSEAERRRWCSMKARRANRERLMSGRPEDRLGWQDVWSVLVTAQGRCACCGSLAVEGRPSKPNGAPAPWAPVGRRIGSLSHVVARIHGGQNVPSNLGWICLWCNTWPSERIPGATDHGAVQ